jgi:TRAP-type C4-dicarboxylate transport system permease small subunit
MKKIMIALLLAMPAMASAADSSINFGLDTFDNSGLGDNDLKTTIASLLNVVLGFLGILAVLIILLGGFKWMTSQGDSGKVDDAKNLIGAGVIGLVIILASYAIASFVLEEVYTATGGNFTN